MDRERPGAAACRVYRSRRADAPGAVLPLDLFEQVMTGTVQARLRAWLTAPSAPFYVIRAVGPVVRERHVPRTVLALSGESSLAEPLLRRSGFHERRTPPYVGFVLNPEWLALRYTSDAATMERLLRELGYVSGDIESSTLEWLRHGVRFVGPRMTARCFERGALQRIRDLVRALLPESLGVLGDAEFDHDDALELEFLLAAVRESDADQLGSTPNTVRAADGSVLTVPVDWELLPPGDVTKSPPCELPSS